MKAQNNYDGPACELCSTNEQQIYFMPTFVFADFQNGIVDGLQAAVINSMTPAWVCPGCGKLKQVTFEEADHWRAFWFDMMLELSNVITKTQFLGSAPFGKGKDNA